MKHIYILLTRTHTLLSNVINHITNASYTHVSIGFDKNFDNMFSFARKNPYLLLPAGLVKEDINTGLFKRKMEISECCLYELSISDEGYEMLKKRLYGFLSENESLKYSVLGLLFCYFNVEYKNDKRYFCSQFVAELLVATNEVALPKSPCLMQPNDFKEIPNLNRLYVGKLSELNNFVENRREKVNITVTA